MRAYLQIAPWWVWSLINGLLFAGLTIIFGEISYPGSAHPFRKVVIGVVGGVVLGAIMGPIVVRQLGEVAVAGDLSNDDLLIGR